MHEKKPMNGWHHAALAIILLMFVLLGLSIRDNDSRFTEFTGTGTEVYIIPEPNE